jgi:hypothetical protein
MSVKKMHVKSYVGAALLTAASFGVGSTAHAATIVDWKPGPTSTGVPEFTFNGTSLSASAGATSNGDGTLPTNVQTAGGLDMSTPFIINGVPGSQTDAPANTTTFYDAAISLQGFAVSAPAQNVFNTLVQPLGSGVFSLTSTTGVVLLHGTVGSSTIAGSNGSGAGALFSANNVTYDGGLIYNQLVADGGTLINNDFSFSFANVSPTFSIAAASGFLTPFTTDATGLYMADAIPEPASLGALAVGALALTRRRAMNRNR